ncbi:hypothetical protein [Paracraurococcus ruber]|uniref:Uncharacterized protein n=1 Tax=Paracraurococcus ruber TaxID=77675 RepID=A0ABS1D206_9PROT|nr:hypothetical protein [Paracraurococcus ruber]MBK1660870.1 hypothetical protein [Paracraurococcus ruber]TDG29890.1 hypothetical protein E2C05_16355 [Paracraurococcus ruber]
MQPAFDRTDWSVLSALLRLAQREGWRVEFAPDRILVSSRRAAAGIVALPAVLLRHARGGGWHCAVRGEEVALRHPAVRHRVTLRLGGWAPAIPGPQADS